MSVRKLTANLLAALVVLGGITNLHAWGWDHEPVAVDPFEFDPDFHWFEPVYNMDLADMKPSKRAHTGWFATYDRLNLYGSRPDITSAQDIDSKLDSGWGHRYEIGYMLPDVDSGWLFNWTDLGVHEGEIVGPKLLEVFVELNQAYPVSGLPNLSGTNTLNDIEYDSYELNKTWRLEPYHYGGILEPMIGVRYMKVRDVTRFEDFIPNPVPDDIDFGDVATQVARTRNDMLGAQLGFRYFKFHQRYTMSAEFRAFAGGSWQCSMSQQSLRDVRLEQFTNPAGGTYDQVVTQRIDIDPAIRSDNDNGFVGFEVRTELAYQLTRQFTVRCGVQLIDIATGVWRGGDGSLGSLPAGDTNQDFLAVGGTFGITLNR